MAQDMEATVSAIAEIFRIEREIARAEREEIISRCPACGDPIDYCQGHGRIGDPIGASILSAHDDGLHGRCNPLGCEDAALMLASIIGHRVANGTLTETDWSAYGAF